ncbi:addiction module antidote protein [Desulfonema magnum]|uniref:Addiction module antidote protein domain-containing protein n=1 Tax=Desulfonema magnum TaxID=45655 RepID=A0A975BPC2_9BACT|nr:addiction module antidote protein [Desulfonema magnum]QTA88967.1 putative addiction module antidote protein domain-containing protein [Desulfonema magnum]
MSLKVRMFDIFKHLETDEDIQGFLQEVVSTGDTSDFIHALNIAAKAKGMSEVVRRAGVTRATLYNSLSEDGNPRFETISKIVNALGCKLAVI